MPQSPGRMPLFERLEIESQSNCNRSCWFCPRTYDDTGAYLASDGRSVIHQMPAEKILDLLEQAKALGFEGLVTFHFYSEPLLDRRNLEFAMAARDLGMHPFLHTNGDPLRTNDTLCEAVQDAYDFIVVGLYDYTSFAEYEDARAFWRSRLPRTDLRFSFIRPTPDRAVPSIGIPRALVPTDSRMSIPDLVYPNGPCSRPLIGCSSATTASSATAAKTSTPSSASAASTSIHSRTSGIPSATNASCVTSSAAIANATTSAAPVR